jgi:hypothetical protein
MTGFWRAALAFLVGVAVGVTLTILAPRVAGQYLPEAVRGKVELLEGEVTRKLREPDRLLLTVVTPQGAVLATFKRQLTEIDLLVEQGDVVTLGVRRVDPFVDDPVIRRVRKEPSPGEVPPVEQAPPSGPEPPPSGPP